MGRGRLSDSVKFVDVEADSLPESLQEPVQVPEINVTDLVSPPRPSVTGEGGNLSEQVTPRIGLVPYGIYKKQQEAAWAKYREEANKTGTRVLSRRSLRTQHRQVTEVAANSPKGWEGLAPEAYVVEDLDGVNMVRGPGKYTGKWSEEKKPVYDSSNPPWERTQSSASDRYEETVLNQSEISALRAALKVAHQPEQDSSKQPVEPESTESSLKMRPSKLNLRHNHPADSAIFAEESFEKNKIRYRRIKGFAGMAEHTIGASTTTKPEDSSFECWDRPGAKPHEWQFLPTNRVFYREVDQGTYFQKPMAEMPWGKYPRRPVPHNNGPTILPVAANVDKANAVLFENWNKIQKTKSKKAEEVFFSSTEGQQVMVLPETPESSARRSKPAPVELDDETLATPTQVPSAVNVIRPFAPQEKDIATPVWSPHRIRRSLVEFGLSPRTVVYGSSVGSPQGDRAPKTTGSFTPQFQRTPNTILAQYSIVNMNGRGMVPRTSPNGPLSNQPRTARYLSDHNISQHHSEHKDDHHSPRPPKSAPTSTQKRRGSVALHTKVFSHRHSSENVADPDPLAKYGLRVVEQKFMEHLRSDSPIY